MANHVDTATRNDLPIANGKDNVDQLPAWTKGNLDIHHISTGRGNAAYLIMPDGTTMLIDAGETDPDAIKSLHPLVGFPARPNEEESAAFWIVDYIKQFSPCSRPMELDYALVTHFHTDHIGTLLPSSRLSKTGKYRLCGITEVSDLIPIKTLVDRAAPDYAVPVNLRLRNETASEKALINYIEMVQHRMKTGREVIGLKAGALDQIRLREPSKFPEFHIRNIASSGVVWTGHGGESRHFVPPNAIGEDQAYDENVFSTVLKLEYGDFSYFTGGDIPGVPSFDQPWWRDMESAVAPVVGRVSAMTLNHHGNRDATNGNILRALQPRVIIQQNWLSAQPGEEVVWRLASKEFYAGPRDVFPTGLAYETRAAIGPLLDSVYRSYGSHVVIRVRPGGHSYDVYLLNDRNTKREVLSHYGPYKST